MASNSADPSTAGELTWIFEIFLSTNCYLDDDEYQVQYADEEDDDERTIEEEEQLGSDDEDNELDDLEAVKFFVCLFKFKRIFLLVQLGCEYAIGRITQTIRSKCPSSQS